METKFLNLKGEFELENGQFLNNVQIAYLSTGYSDIKKTVWVCHALSGNANVFEWWSGLFGENQLFNPDNYNILCANVIGSCYGSTGPDDVDESITFPTITIRDMVKAHSILADVLEISKIDILIGASLGGQQAIEWAIHEPTRISNLILIATNAVHSPFGIAFNEAQRLALIADLTFGKANGGKNGLKAARAIAMLSYRSYEDFALKQKDEEDRIGQYRASSYLSYQGDKFVSRFSPTAYYTIIGAMNSHNVGRDRGGLKKALAKVQANTLVVNVSSDFLFPLSEQALICKYIPHVCFGRIDSIHGHDAFLIEYKQLTSLITNFLFKPIISKYSPLN
jgi:homoserine O-acetyltransferase